MSDYSETESELSSSNSTDVSSDEDGSNLEGAVAAYAGEPLATAEEVARRLDALQDGANDPDGLAPQALAGRFDKTVPIQQWYVKDTYVYTHNNISNSLLFVTLFVYLLIILAQKLFGPKSFAPFWIGFARYQRPEGPFLLCHCSCGAKVMVRISSKTNLKSMICKSRRLW